MTTTTLGGVSDPEDSRRHTIRIPDPLWAAVKAKAYRQGLTVSDVVRERLAGFLDEPDPPRRRGSRKSTTRRGGRIGATP